MFLICKRNNAKTNFKKKPENAHKNYGPKTSPRLQLKTKENALCGMQNAKAETGFKVLKSHECNGLKWFPRLQIKINTFSTNVQIEFKVSPVGALHGT